MSFDSNHSLLYLFPLLVKGKNQMSKSLHFSLSYATGYLPIYSTKEIKRETLELFSSKVLSFKNMLMTKLVT